MADSFFGFDTTLPVSSDGQERRRHKGCGLSCTNAGTHRHSFKPSRPIFNKFSFSQSEERSLGRELSEDDYDALNDETFTHAVRDDWEGEEDSVLDGGVVTRKRSISLISFVFFSRA